ncbi:MAG: hypothetical protein ACLUO9_00035 [Coprococcus comes]
MKMERLSMEEWTHQWLMAVAGHAFLGMDGDSPGYFARAQVTP